MRGGKRDNAGRKPGTPNKITTDLLQAIQNKYPGFNPVVAMVDIYHDESLEMPLRLQALKEATKYTHQQRKAIDVTTEPTTDDVVHVFKIGDQVIPFI